MSTHKYSTDQVTAYFASFNATLQIGNFAAQLAEQAGEEASRPLTKEQMNRAFSLLRAERAHILDLLEEAGLLTQDDGSRSYSVSFEKDKKPD